MEEGGTKRKAAFLTAIRAPPHLSISLETLPHPLAQPASRWKVRLNADVGKEVQQQAGGVQLSSERIKKLMRSLRLGTLYFSRTTCPVDIESLVQAHCWAIFEGRRQRRRSADIPVYPVDFLMREW